MEAKKTRRLFVLMVGEDHWLAIHLLAMGDAEDEN